VADAYAFALVVVALLVVVFVLLLVVLVVLDLVVSVVFVLLVVVVAVVDLVVFVLVVFVVFVVFVVEDEEAETILPSGEQGKSRSAVDSILVQKYSDDPLLPTRSVPVAVISSQISLQTKLTTSLFFVPVPVTSM